MTGLDDRDLRERFAELRAADRVGARSVADTLARPAGRVRRASRAAVIVSTAAVLVAVVWIGRDRHPDAIPISQWQPASDVLLRAARPPILGPMPPLGASVLDAYLPSPSR